MFGRSGGVSSGRQEHSEPAAGGQLAVDVLDLDDAPVRLDDALDDGQAEPGALPLGALGDGGAGRSPAPGQVEHPADLLVRQPAALVAHAELDALGDLPATD